MLSRLLVGCLLASTGFCVPISEHEQKLKKRDVSNVDGENDIPLGSYQSQILPGMVDDQVAEALLKDAAAADEREEQDEQTPLEVPLALPMSRLVDDDEVLQYAEEKPAPHRSKALPEDVYPADDGDAYIPYYPASDVYFRRRRRSRPVTHITRKRSPYSPMKDLLRSGRLRSVRRKRQIRLSDNDLGTLIAFLTDLKDRMERSSGDCNNPAHHSFFRENELSEELGAGSGIDDNYSDDEQRPYPEQEYPVWLMPHAYQLEPVMPSPQRRAFLYPTMLPGQKRSLGVHFPNAKRLESRLLGLSGPPEDDRPPRRLFQ